MLSLRTGGELRLSYVSSVHTNSIILRIIHTKRISTKIASVKEIDGVNESKSCLGHVMQLRASNHVFETKTNYAPSSENTSARKKMLNAQIIATCSGSEKT